MLSGIALVGHATLKKVKIDCGFQGRSILLTLFIDKFGSIERLIPEPAGGDALPVKDVMKDDLDTNHHARIVGYDYIRAISIVIVILFHYSASYDIYLIKGFNDFFYSFGRTGWGSIAVYMFLMISGASLYHTYAEKINIYEFYKKRWLSIFPQFYLLWIALYFVQSYLHGTFLWGGEFCKLLLTFFGIDGYFLYLGKNYYIIGEWFLGAIIILYILFPILLYLIKRHEKFFTLFLLIILIINTELDIFEISLYRNVITCLIIFWLGMIFDKYRNRIDRYPSTALLAMLLAFLAFNFEINAIYYTIIFSVLFFVVLYFVPQGVKISATIEKTILIVSAYSYSLFLVHHVVIRWIMKPLHGGGLSIFEGIALLTFILFIIIFVSFFLNYLNKIIIAFFYNCTNKYFCCSP